MRWWLYRQGLSKERGEDRLTRTTLVSHLERTGGLQLDSINVLDRAHYLTLWSRYGCYDRRDLDRWVYDDRAGFEYWAHEASILPASHLPLALRRMERFPPDRWKNSAYWPRLKTSAHSKRRALRRLELEGPLESLDFKRDPGATAAQKGGWSSSAGKEDSRSLNLLWHAGRTAVARRLHFRRVYDLAERVYPQVMKDAVAVGKREFEDSWLLRALSGCGVASEAHLQNYITGPKLMASARRRVIKRHLQAGAIREVEVAGVAGICYAQVEDLDRFTEAPEARGTTLICPFDSLLWQRLRAQELLDFQYTVEIYVPAVKRRFGYYVLPILHNGRLVGRLDPKLHRDRSELEIKSIFLEENVQRGSSLERGLARSLSSLAEFLGAQRITLPRTWRDLL